MIPANLSEPINLESSFKMFHDLMARKVRNIMLVSSLYEACIMEEDCRLSERIIDEYRGLNLSQPPRLTWVSTGEKALAMLDRKNFEMVITMLRLADMDAYALAEKIRAKAPDLPVVLLTPGTGSARMSHTEEPSHSAIDRTFVWNGNNDLLLALVKSAEDRLNVADDTASAGIRVILFVEDSPEYISALLPILYRELVLQTQAALEEKLNEEHRLLTMRARPKILVAKSYEEACKLYTRYEPYILGVISDMRFPRNGKLDPDAGLDFLSMVKQRRWDIPLLLTSAESTNAAKVGDVPTLFVDKNSPSLIEEVRAYFSNHLGFGDFVFRRADGREIGRAPTVLELVQMLESIPDESFLRHTNRNDFSRWFFARSEIWLANCLRPITESDFAGDVVGHRRYLIDLIHGWRRHRQRGVVASFDTTGFDPDIDFYKLGRGSLGGKARGLAFMAQLLQRHQELFERFPEVSIVIPKTLVITTEGFDSFIDANGLRGLADTELPDDQIADAVLAARLPQWLRDNLRAYLGKVHYPLAIRSSGLLEDAQFRAYAGLYRTYMITNDCPDLDTRLNDLINAVKLVYASTFLKGPRAFSRRIGQRTAEEKMAVIIQQLVGRDYDGYFYPAISGVAQSQNYYPFDRMRAEDGIATIALGLGRAVVEGERTLRFSPRHPQLLPQRSTVEDILANSQRWFYALSTGKQCSLLDLDEASTLARREISDARHEAPVKMLCSGYVPAEHRIRDALRPQASPVVTFAAVLKYGRFPLPDLLVDVLAMGQEGMGCPVEIEFSVNLDADRGQRPEFALLQIRPMTARAEMTAVNITADDRRRAFCVSSHALGNARNAEMRDILYVKPDAFDPAHTATIAQEIDVFNRRLVAASRRYVLIGPGRWGSADRWLGIPVEWPAISGVGAIVEATAPQLNAEPSQGSHFFHNITTLGINYFSVAPHKGDVIDWEWIISRPVIDQSRFVAHARLDRPLLLKVDGRTAEGILAATG